MARWEPDARGRLERAALDLYTERGYDQTTVAEIAERAGLTERTFFRHFADKREVLFAGSATLQAVLVEAVTNAPTTNPPLDTVLTALKAAGALLQQRRPHSQQRQAVITANPELQERELIKLATLATATAQALRHRGTDPQTATLTAETGITLFKVAFVNWLADTTPHPPSLPHHLQTAADHLKTLTTPT